MDARRRPPELGMLDVGFEELYLPEVEREANSLAREALPVLRDVDMAIRLIRLAMVISMLSLTR